MNGNETEPSGSTITGAPDWSNDSLRAMPIAHLTSARNNVQSRSRGQVQDDTPSYRRGDMAAPAT
jgi:hypothetical protein